MTRKPSKPSDAASRSASAGTGERKIGRFSIIKRLGRGAQGAVYLARDPDLDRLVAVKLVSELPDGGGDVYERARLLAQLRHPNIVALYEAGRFHNFTYLVLEYLTGKALNEELRPGVGFALARAYSTMLQITDAMAYAHAKGILHLDLNPNNVMYDDDGKPRVMDFDLSRRVGVQAQAQLIVGTLPYMAPEYFLTHVLDARTDVYALGQMLYTLLCGRTALGAGSEAELVRRVCNAQLDFSALQDVGAAGLFAEVIRRATAKAPDERYPGARAMREALMAVWMAQSEDSAARSAPIHGTVAFAMKRIERRGDFPAVSKSLADINRLTSGESASPMSQLAAVVLRDFALTNRLLKLANSSYYPSAKGTVRNVSDAIALLGVEQVRLACNSLACFAQFGQKKSDARLREASIAAFIAGLVARHLAIELNVKQTEEVFLAGMLLQLGRTLVLFYFPDDFDEIEDLVARGASPDEAARSVLGVPFGELGYAVGDTWRLPPMVLHCMRESVVAEAPAQNDPLRAIVRFANDLVAVDAASDPGARCIAASGAQLPAQIRPSLAQAQALLVAALDKFKSFAPVLEVDLSGSACVKRIEAWLEANAPAAAAQASEEIPPGDLGGSKHS